MLAETFDQRKAEHIGDHEIRKLIPMPFRNVAQLSMQLELSAFVSL